MSKPLDKTQALLEGLLTEMPVKEGRYRELMVYYMPSSDPTFKEWSVEAGNPSQRALLGEEPGDFLGQGHTLAEAVENLRKVMIANDGRRVID